MKKTSNRILAGLIILGIIIGFTFVIFIKVKGDYVSEKHTEVTINDDIVEVVFYSNTRKSELDKIQDRLKKEKNIDLKVEKSEFDNEGHIIYLEIEVDCNDGFSGSTQAKEYDLKLGKCGFIRNYTDTSENAFTIYSKNTYKTYND